MADIASAGSLGSAAPAPIASHISDPESGERVAFLATLPRELIDGWSRKDSTLPVLSKPLW